MPFLWCPGQTGPALFPPDVLGLLVLSQPDETAMPKVPFWSPFDKLELTNQHGLDPMAIGHFLRCESGAPTSRVCFRQICERAYLNLKRLEFLHDFRAEFRREPVPRARRIYK